MAHTHTHTQNMTHFFFFVFSVKSTGRTGPPKFLRDTCPHAPNPLLATVPMIKPMMNRPSVADFCCFFVNVFLSIRLFSPADVLTDGVIMNLWCTGYFIFGASGVKLIFHGRKSIDDRPPVCHGITWLPKFIIWKNIKIKFKY